MIILKSFLALLLPVFSAFLNPALPAVRLPVQDVAARPYRNEGYQRALAALYILVLVWSQLVFLTVRLYFLLLLCKRIAK